MKLTLTNFGRIDHAELDIRPLTVFIGPNNTNKTWAAYALYGLGRGLSAGELLGPAMVGTSEPVSPVLKRLREILGDLFNPDVVGAGKSVEIQFSRNGIWETSKFLCRAGFDAKELRKLLRLGEQSGFSGSANLQFWRNELYGPDWTATARTDGLITTVWSDEWKFSTSTANSDIPPATRLDRLAARIETYALRLFAECVPFPAERNLIASDPAAWVIPGRPIRLPLPVTDFAQVLHNLPRQSKEPLSFDDFAEHLQAVLGGSVRFRHPADSPDLEFVHAAGAALPVAAAASMVRSLAGLQLYIEHRCKAGDMLVIDEPEMNAHPEAQLGIIELLAMLVNKGIRVVLTTHSPYIVDHLNNLIEAAALPHEKKESAALDFQLKSSDAFLDCDKSAVYLFGGNGKVTDALDRERRVIDISTFGDVTDRLNRLYSKLLQQSGGGGR